MRDNYSAMCFFINAKVLAHIRTLSRIYKIIFEDSISQGSRKSFETQALNQFLTVFTRIVKTKGSHLK